MAAIVVSALLVLVAMRWPEPTQPPETPARVDDSVWLSREAAAQIVGDAGGLGPLFAGVELGGAFPSHEIQTRIAAFARANTIEIELERDHDRLAAVRFAATFGGCCGYEGVDVLALRFGRPHTGGGCTGGEDRWIDHWTTRIADTHARVDIRVNRIEVRWQPLIGTAELLGRASQLLHASASTVTKAATWTEVERGHRYRVGVPYPFSSAYEFGLRLDGLEVAVEHGEVTEVAFTLGVIDLDEPPLADLLRARWGRPQQRDGTWTWRLADRIITAEVDSTLRRITIAAR
ncbi:MAG: hypothetical protein ABI867_02470 [Kofleriaceae bacterium]